MKFFVEKKRYRILSEMTDLTDDTREYEKISQMLTTYECVGRQNDTLL